MKKKTKKRKGKVKVSAKRRGPVVVAVSGGFDPVHIGHVRMFNEARKLGDKLVVILNNDNWLKKKKGAAFMPEHERKEIIEALAAVDEVIMTSHPENLESPEEMSVCRELAMIKPDIFAKGGDRTVANSKEKTSSLSPEALLCERLGIKLVFNVGFGGKVQSSSWLIAKAKENDKLKTLVKK